MDEERAVLEGGVWQGTWQHFQEGFLQGEAVRNVFRGLVSFLSPSLPRVGSQRKGSLAVGGTGPSLAGPRSEAACGLAGKSKDSSAEEDDSQPGIPHKSGEVRMNQPLKVE